MEGASASLSDLGSPGWILGLFILAAVVGAPALAVPRHRLRPHPQSLWDLPRVSQIYTTVVGSFAGFAAASTVFVARLGFDRPTQAFEEVMGLLALSFMMLATSAMQFGNMPNAPIEGETFARTQRLSFLVSNVAVTAGIIASWLSLQSLTAYIGLAGLSEALGVFMLLVVALGLLRLAQYLFDCTALPGRICVLIPAIAVLGSSAYFFIFRRFAPNLLPPAGEPFHYAFTAAISVGLGFAGQSTVFSMLMHGQLSETLSYWCERLAVAHTIWISTLLCLLALSMLTR